jgi:uncharacterized membrane protein
VAEALAQLAEWIALGVETAAAVLIGVGAVQALLFVFDPRRRLTIGRKRLAWLHFARWLVLALEFELPLTSSALRSHRAGTTSASWD